MLLYSNSTYPVVSRAREIYVHVVRIRRFPADASRMIVCVRTIPKIATLTLHAHRQIVLEIAGVFADDGKNNARERS